MFKFDLPKWALLPVVTPEGSTHVMVHVGNGQFVSQLPPVAINTCQPLDEPEPEGLAPVTWDSGVLDAEVRVSRAMFDAAGAAEALRKAADSGDVTAITTQARLKAAAADADLVLPGH